jgi:hypothetical protein
MHYQTGRDITDFYVSEEAATGDINNFNKRRNLCQQEIEWDHVTWVQGQGGVWVTVPEMTSPSLQTSDRALWGPGAALSAAAVTATGSTPQA